MTVAKAITEALPQESLIYFGDTAHFPYGDKSIAAIQAYSVKISNVLLQQGCKAIIIACNSASSAAFELVKEYVGSRALVINVIDPSVNYIKAHFEGKRVGVIGTKRTIDSNVYKSKVDHLNVGVDVASLATPLLAPMIEEGFFENKISHTVIAEYLERSELGGIEALILGCTHYPLIKEQIESYYDNRVEVVDSASVVAGYLKDILIREELLRKEEPKHHFFVSDLTSYFEASTALFFGREVSLERYKLWE